MGYLYDDEILVAVCDNGVVVIFFMFDIEHEPIKLINDCNISTWGIALYGPLGYIAVSANNFIIKMYKILKVNKKQINNLKENCIQSEQNNNNNKNNTEDCSSDINNNSNTNNINDNRNISNTCNFNDSNNNNNNNSNNENYNENNNRNDDNNNNNENNILISNEENNTSKNELDEIEVCDSEIEFEEYYINNNNSGKIIENHPRYLLGKECMYFRGHKHNIPYISFSKDGKYLISSSIDSTIKIWNVSTGKKVYSKIIEKNGWNWTGNFIEINHGYIYKEQVIDEFIKSIHVHDDFIDRFMAMRRFFPNIPNISINIQNLINRRDILLNPVRLSQALNNESDQDEGNQDEEDIIEHIDVIDSGSEISFQEDNENIEEQSIEDSEVGEKKEKEYTFGSSTFKSEHDENFNLNKLEIFSKEKNDIKEEKNYHSIKCDKIITSNDKDFSNIQSYDLMGNQKIIMKYKNKNNSNCSRSNYKNINSKNKNEEFNNDNEILCIKNSLDCAKDKKKKNEEEDEPLGNTDNTNLNNININIVNNPDYHEINIESSHLNISNRPSSVHEVEIIEDSNNNIINDRYDARMINDNINYMSLSDNSSFDSSREPNDFLVESRRRNNDNEEEESSLISNDSESFYDAIGEDNDNYNSENDNIFSNANNSENLFNIEENMNAFNDTEYHSNIDDNNISSYISFHSSEDNMNDFNDIEYHGDSDDNIDIFSDISFHSNEENRNSIEDSEIFIENNDESNEQDYYINNTNIIMDGDEEDENSEEDIDNEGNSGEDNITINSTSSYSIDSEESENIHFTHSDNDENELCINVNNNTFLLVSTILDIYLLDKKGNVLDILKNPFEPYCKSLNRFSRISILEWIPNIDTAVVANQKGIFGLLRIVNLKNINKYKMVIETFLPDKSPLCPIAGISIKSYYSNVDPLLSYYLIYVAFLNGSLYIYKLKYNTNSFPLSLTKL
jgi:hypothetical protein